MSAQFASRAEAEAWRASVVAALARGEPVPEAPASPEPVAEPQVVAGPLTVEDACREWIRGALTGVVKTRTGRPYGDATVYTHEGRLRLHVLPYLGALPAASLTPGVVRRWLEELEAAATATTARMSLDSLRVVMRRLLEHELIVANPCTGVRAPVNDDERRRTRFLEPAEADALRAAAAVDAEPRLGPLIDLGLATGARRGELLALVWGPGGLDLEERTVRIAASYSMRTGKVGPVKGGGPGRVVPVGQRTAARMREHLLASGRPAAGERVFPFDPRPPWERVRRRAGLAEPLPTVHSLRHTAATWWLASGLTVHAVAELLGHADRTLVIKRYGHALPSERSTAGERLEAFLEASAAR